jgi:alkylation response protein AidB-like acyl-CoA dehydrogenase
MNERVALGSGPVPRGGGPIADLVEVWRSVRDRLPEAIAPVYRDAVADLWIRAELVRLTNQRAKATSSGGAPGPEGSVGKLASAEIGREIYALALDLLGAEGMLHQAGYPMTRSEAMRSTGVSGRFLRSRASTIEGGTSEIMRNILGERVLGLPGDVRVDTDVPWRQIPR